MVVGGGAVPGGGNKSSNCFPSSHQCALHTSHQCRVHPSETAQYCTHPDAFPSTLLCTALHWTMLNYFELHFTAMQHSSLSSHLFPCHPGASHIVQWPDGFSMSFCIFQTQLTLSKRIVLCPDTFRLSRCISSAVLH